MQDIAASVLAGIGSALVVLGGYHFLVAVPRLRSARGRPSTRTTACSAAAAPNRRRAASTISRRRPRRAERERAGLTARIEALEKVAQSETPRIGFVRYNAFDDVGSDQSYALALLTRDGDGVVLSSIYSREETRTYGKAVEKFQTAARRLARRTRRDRSSQGGRDVTDNAFLIKIVPPEGYNVYRLHFSRHARDRHRVAPWSRLWARRSGFHAWQLHLAEARYAALQARRPPSSAEAAGDRPAGRRAGRRSCATSQRENAEIRQLIGVPAVPAPPVRSDARSRRRPDAGDVGGRPGTPRAPRPRIRSSALGPAARSPASRIACSTCAGSPRSRAQRMIAALPVDQSGRRRDRRRLRLRLRHPWPEFHQGVDLAADYGTPVHAAADGVVAAAGWDGGFGIKVDIDHGNGYHTLVRAPLAGRRSASGQHVTQGRDDRVGRRDRRCDRARICTIR